MSLKQEIETWVQALAHYDNNEFEESLKTFEVVSDTSKILFNCGVIHATLGEHGKAVECYQRAVRLDQYLAVAYFQQGVSNFLVGDFEEALANFNDTLLYLRGNTYIDYEQLGLKFKLYSCEVLFNRGLCYIYLQQKTAGLQDFSFAIKEKVVEDHSVIDEAIKEEAEGYTVFSIPVGVVYRPNSAKVKNLKTKDYLGKARLIAASDRSNAFTGFTGSEVKNVGPILSRTRQRILTEHQHAVRNEQQEVKDDRPTDSISFAASNLVKPDLRSRARQQSEPPLNRQVFPPTPPPESDRPPQLSTTTPTELTRPTSASKPQISPINVSRSNTATSKDFARSEAPSMTGRAASVRNGQGRPARLDLPQTREHERPPERPRLGTMRTASEPRGPSRNYMKSRNPEFSYQSRTLRDTPLRQTVKSEPDAEDEYADELYDMYQSNSRSQTFPRRGSSRARQKPGYIKEEEEPISEEDDDDDGSSVDEGEFEMVYSSRRPRKLSSRAGSTRIDVRKIRVKAHVQEDTRYLVFGNSINFQELTTRIRDKFALSGRFKCKMEDDGDMITMGDQDDLDMAVSTCKQAARRERAEMGKIEVSNFIRKS
ncbi:MAG: hypothetical protein M1817_002866 [Caeruleum heppii]|nr:MAG: hypothetical protein M1817_002866 [Caeruleum heppii]